jgi:1-acyl-sn-glycerol-3-phosphate acyltransferase
MTKVLYRIYFCVFFVPVGAVITILTAVFTIFMCAFFDNRVWGFYPARTWARLLCHLSFVRVKVTGRENIQKNHSYIFASNHQSVYDIFAIYGWLNLPFKWIMKKELEKIPFVGQACKSAGHIFIVRGQTKAALQSIIEAKKKLVNGLSVVIFPEGSRTFTGEVGAFKRGAFQMAADLQLPIVPITIKGAFEVMPRTTYWASPRTIELIIHEAVDTSEYVGNQSGLMEKVREAIIK